MEAINKMILQNCMRIYFRFKKLLVKPSFCKSLCCADSHKNFSINGPKPETFEISNADFHKML